MKKLLILAIFLLLTETLDSSGAQVESSKPSESSLNDDSSIVSFDNQMYNLDEEDTGPLLGGWKKVPLENSNQFAHINQYVRAQMKDFFEGNNLEITEVWKQVVNGFNYRIIYKGIQDKQTYKAIVYEGIQGQLSKVDFENITGKEEEQTSDDM